MVLEQLIASSIEEPSFRAMEVSPLVPYTSLVISSIFLGAFFFYSSMNDFNTMISFYHVSRGTLH